MDVEFKNNIAGATKRIIDDLTKLESMPEESEHMNKDSIREQLDNMLSQQNQTQLNNLIRWAKLQKEKCKDFDEELKTRKADHDKALSETVSSGLRSLFSSMEKWSNNLNNARRNFDDMSVKFMNWVEYLKTNQGSGNDSYDTIEIPTLRIETKIFNNEEMVKLPIEEQLIHLKTREQYYLKIIQSAQKLVLQTRLDYETLNTAHTKLQSDFKDVTLNCQELQAKLEEETDKCKEYYKSVERLAYLFKNRAIHGADSLFIPKPELELNIMSDVIFDHENEQNSQNSIENLADEAEEEELNENAELDEDYQEENEINAEIENDSEIDENDDTEEDNVDNNDNNEEINGESATIVEKTNKIPKSSTKSKSKDVISKSKKIITKNTSKTVNKTTVKSNTKSNQEITKTNATKGQNKINSNNTKVKTTSNNSQKQILSNQQNSSTSSQKQMPNATENLPPNSQKQIQNVTKNISQNSQKLTANTAENISQDSQKQIQDAPDKIQEVTMKSQSDSQNSLPSSNPNNENQHIQAMSKENSISLKPTEFIVDRSTYNEISIQTELTSSNINNKIEKAEKYEKLENNSPDVLQPNYIQKLREKLLPEIKRSLMESMKSNTNTIENNRISNIIQNSADSYSPNKEFKLVLDEPENKENKAQISEPNLDDILNSPRKILNRHSDRAEDSQVSPPEIPIKVKQPNIVQQKLSARRYAPANNMNSPRIYRPGVNNIRGSKALMQFIERENYRKLQERLENSNPFQVFHLNT